MMFVLGIISGLLISIILFLVEQYLSPAERPLTRLQSFSVQRKGAILEPETPQDEYMRKNDEQGLDTLLDDI